MEIKRWITVIVLISTIVIVLFLTSVFTIKQYGCTNPIITEDPVFLRSLDCKALEMLLLTEKTYEVNQTLYCANVNKVTVRLVTIGKPDFKEEYIRRCVNPYIENLTQK